MDLQTTILTEALNDSKLSKALRQNIDETISSVRQHIDSAEQDFDAIQNQITDEVYKLRQGTGNQQVIVDLIGKLQNVPSAPDFIGQKSWTVIWAMRPDRTKRGKGSGLHGDPTRQPSGLDKTKVILESNGELKIINIMKGHPSEGSSFTFTRHDWITRFGLKNQDLAVIHLCDQIGHGDWARNIYAIEDRNAHGPIRNIQNNVRSVMGKN